MPETREQIIEQMAEESRAGYVARRGTGAPFADLDAERMAWWRSASAQALPVAVKAVTDRVREFIGTFDEVRDDDGEDPVALTVRVKDVRHLLDQIDAELGGEHA